MAKVDWNPGDNEPRAGFETLPKGRYLTLVSDSEQKKNSKGTGDYYEIEFDVVRPDKYRNRKLWARLNVHHESEEAQRIGREQFSALCEATGLDRTKVADTTALHNRPVICIVDIEQGTKGEMNKITGWLKPTTEDAANAKAHKTAPKQARPASAPREAPPSHDPGSLDDDIPF